MQEKLQNTWQWLTNERQTVWFEYGALALVVMLPLLLPGFILTLDLVFTPSLAWPTDLTNTYPLEALLWLLHLVLPADVIEKIVLFVILLFSGVGMHTLMRSINMKGKLEPEIWRMALYFGGIFYMINPFTYSRFMAGQWLFLLGYAMLPFFVRALLKFFMKPTLKTVLPLAAWSFAVMTASLHHIGILLLIALAVPVLGAIFGYWKDRAHVKHFLLWSGACLVTLVTVSSFWLVPAVLGKGTIGSAVDSMNQTDFTAFATNGGSLLGKLGEVIRLQGFWVEARQLYTLPQEMIPAWGLLFLPLWALVITGAIKAWKASRFFVALAASSIGIGILLSATPIMAWIGHVIPLFNGYREPQKFVNFIAFGYAILGVFGAAYITQWAADRFNELSGQAVVIVCLFLPLAITPCMLWGFSSQLSPRSYPEGWYQMDTTLKGLSEPKRVLSLPWHQYMEYGFTGRIIANPTEKFFAGTDVIVSDDPEFGSLTPTEPNQEKNSIADALKHPDTLKTTLLARNIHYILLAKEDDASHYAFLDTTPGYSMVNENSSYKLYRLEQ